ncbi:uncharacterized protein JCM15063_004507 [Sporobolomyces koalae]|uniref:uncharacterized protein n=1 Tax=Sporobolomyces koalae TaxID=500713 RepID=UPI00317DE281
MVGIGFIEKMLSLDEANSWHIRTCGEEDHLAYNRVGLTEYFEHRNVTGLYLQTASWYAEQSPERFSYSIGEKVVEIDRQLKCVRTSKGNVYQYDVLVLATGSNGALPPYAQSRAPQMKGVFVYRNIADLEAIIKYAARDNVKRASVVGGGLLGLEAAKAVYDLPTIPSVEILIRQNFPLNRQIDAAAGELVLNKIEGMGVRVRVACEPTGLITKEIDGETCFGGFTFADGQRLESDLCVYGVGISPRDELAVQAGIKVNSRGGIEVGDDLQTSEPDVYAIGECANWKGNTYGLIGPGIEMADILAFNLTQTASHAPRKMNHPDLSTKLKLMGVDVASFGEFDADERAVKAAEAEEARKATEDGEVEMTYKPSRKVPRSTRNDPVKALTYLDPLGSTYKKFIFTADGSRLVGGILIGDTSAFTKLVSLVKKKKKLDVSPSSFILGKKGSDEDEAGDLADDDVVCSCHGTTKGAIAKCVKDGITDFAKVKSCTKAGTGCGGCIPLVTSLLKAEMKKSGKAVSNHLCPHFAMPRADLYAVIKIRKLRTFNEILSTVGKGEGCEVCKPVCGSILASLHGEFVMKKELHGLQDTNDRFLANIQRDGTFSVVPRVAAGEITPAGLIAIGKVAAKYKLYTKITGGQRIDMFGAQKADLLDIWQELIDSGFESGHAYGKSLRTVKSCVGSSWCRFGLDDSVQMATDLETRYKGIRSPHKIKGGVSGCVRECAEAQSKDFGLIATDKGWNIFVGGNGGMKPAHAQLLVADVPPSKVTAILDRYLMFYIRTADRLQRTSAWLESFEGGITKLRRIILDDELGINAELEAEMNSLVGNYFDEWAVALKDPSVRRKFRQFANTDERRKGIEPIEERNQTRPANWPQSRPQRFRDEDLATPRTEWSYTKMLRVDDLEPSEANTSSCAIKYGDTQLAVFHVPRRGYFCTQQMCPHKRAFVLEHGIIGEENGSLYVSCPLHKRNFALDTGDCKNDEDYKILAFNVKEEDGDLLIQLPPIAELDALIGSSKWMVRKATAAVKEKNPTSSLEIVGPDGDAEPDKKAASGSCGEADKSCGGPEGAKLEW